MAKGCSNRGRDRARLVEEAMKDDCCGSSLPSQLRRVVVSKSRGDGRRLPGREARRDPGLLVQALEAARAAVEAPARADAAAREAPEGRAPGARLDHGLFEERQGPRHLLGARGSRLALVQRHDRDAQPGRCARSPRSCPTIRAAKVSCRALLNKKLGHWKSTKATAEVLYSLAHYREREAAVGEKRARGHARRQDRRLRLRADRFTGRKNRSCSRLRDRAVEGRVTVIHRRPRASPSPRRPGCSRRELAGRSARADLFHVERRGSARESRARRHARALAEAPSSRSATSSRSSLSVAQGRRRVRPPARIPRPAGLEPTPRIPGALGSGLASTKRHATAAPTSSSSRCRRRVP